jgi:hypothetical protein
VCIKSICAVFTDDGKWLVAIQLVTENAKDVTNVGLLDIEECFGLDSR